MKLCLVNEFGLVLKTKRLVLKIVTQHRGRSGDRIIVI